MSDIPDDQADDDPEPTPLVDPTPPTASPVILTDVYVQIGAANLSCLGLEVHIVPDVAKTELTTFCGRQEFPGAVLWKFNAKLAQSFDTGATDATLTTVLTAYKTAGTLCPIKVRPYKGRVVGPTNPSFEGNVIPTDYEVFGGSAGDASEVDLEWSFAAPPTRVVA